MIEFLINPLFAAMQFCGNICSYLYFFIVCAIVSCNHGPSFITCRHFLFNQRQFS
uniref:Uncharacterized protein n=1 Tax=Arundo donax TaxID=35708 RepID=A0A0A8Z1S7_ARUDO